MGFRLLFPAPDSSHALLTHVYMLSEFVCSDEGFFPNPNDCKKYFWCLDSPNGLVSHIFTCPSGNSRSGPNMIFLLNYKFHLDFFLSFCAGLHFNKFTDSCDYAANVICKVGGASSSSQKTTPRPFLVKATSLGTKPTTTTTTTTPEPEYDYEYEEEPTAIEEDDEEEFSPNDDLQSLLDLIENLGTWSPCWLTEYISRNNLLRVLAFREGGTDAVKQLLERTSGRGNRGRQEGGEDVRLSSSQRQALEKVIQ